MNKVLKDTRNLAFMGLMLAVTIVLIALPTGGVILLGGTVSATVVHIPTIVTGITLGPVAGLIMGTAFGIVTLIRAAIAPLGVLDPLFVNPLLSVLPRMTIGVAAYLGYKLIASVFKSDRRNTVAAGVGAVFGSVSNTAFVMTMLYLLYAAKVESLIGASFKDLLLSIIGINGLVEVLLSVVVTIPIVLAYRAIKRNH